MFKNMKIEINEQQPLDEVVKELERLGYWRDKNNDQRKIESINTISTWSNGGFCFYESKASDLLGGELTTLTELKEME